VNQSAARSKLVKDGGPPFCPRCGEQLNFECDRQGRTLERCDCGYRAAVALRSGLGVVPLHPPAAVAS